MLARRSQSCTRAASSATANITIQEGARRAALCIARWATRDHVGTLLEDGGPARLPDGRPLAPGEVEEEARLRRKAASFNTLLVATDR